MKTWNLETLIDWDEKIKAKADEYGLNTFPQEFEICDHHEMLNYMAYHGMPSHYAHWSYGKAYEKQKTMYDYGVSGLPYEMVINANPSIAYLMSGNTLALQVLTIAHVYGHNDFFRNNLHFRQTEPENVAARFKNNANRIDKYIEDPSIGFDGVEKILDAAHAISLQCNRNRSIKQLSQKEQRDRAWHAAIPKERAFASIRPPEIFNPPDMKRIPLEPELNLLLFIRDFNPYLHEWQKDLLNIVIQQTDYFVPQMQTKIMNEGWASFWHHRIMTTADLPESLLLEFFVHHNQVLRPNPGSINPYHLGFKIWHNIFDRWENPDSESRKLGVKPGQGMAKIFQVRESDRDASFLRQYLTEDICRELFLFQHEQRGMAREVTEVSSPDGWKTVRETLVNQVGTNGIPVIKILDSDFHRNRELYLIHEHDGRDLDLGYAEKTLAYAQCLWMKTAHLETRINGTKVCLSHDGEHFESKAA